MLANNAPQLATILPHLVRHLHWPKPSLGHSLETQLERLHLANSGVSTILETRARFASYYLLHVLCRRWDLPAFQVLLADLVDFGDEERTAPIRVPSQRISQSQPHIVFVLSVFRIILSNNYAKLARILAKPHQHDKFACLTLQSTVIERQAAAWDTLRASYLSVPGNWLSTQLLLGDESELQGFLERERWSRNNGPGGTVVLKSGSRGQQ